MENSQKFLSFYSHNLKEQGEGFVPYGCKTWKQNPFGLKTFNPTAVSVQCSIYLGGYLLECPFHKSGKIFGQESLQR